VCGRHGGRTSASTSRRILRRGGNLHGAQPTTPIGTAREDEDQNATARGEFVEAATVEAE